MLNRIGLVLMGWWVWPLTLALIGALVLAAGLAVYPGEAEVMYLLGQPLSAEPCSFREAYGVACPNCGMTRSWVFAARGQPLRALAYNPAGASLFVLVVGGGALGLVRLLTRRAGLLAMSWSALAITWGGWFLLLYLGHFLARATGLNALPL